MPDDPLGNFVTPPVSTVAGVETGDGVADDVVGDVEVGEFAVGVDVEDAPPPDPPAGSGEQPERVASMTTRAEEASGPNGRTRVERRRLRVVMIVPLLERKS